MFCPNCGKEMQIKTKRHYDIYTGEYTTEEAVCKNCNITREITPKQNNVTIAEVLEKFNNKTENTTDTSNETHISSDGYCPKCGMKMRIQSKKEGYSARHGYSYRVYNICDECSIVEDLGVVNETDVKRVTHNKIKIKEEKPIYYVKKDNSGWIGLIIIAIIIFIASINSVKEPKEDEVVKQTETPIATESKEDYIASCEEYEYKKVLRNPDEYIGKKIKAELNITHVHEKSENVPTKYYMAIEETGLISWNQYVVMDVRYQNSPKLLEGDAIVVYGEIIEPMQTINGLNKISEAVAIDMRYVELKQEQ